MKEIRYKLEELPSLIPEIWNYLKRFRIITLNGGLGAGKTTFTVHLCNYLKTKESATSPTFSLINEYVFEDEKGQLQSILHSDWYRIENEEEAINAGIEDMLDQKDAYCIIEWPEKAASLLPDTMLLDIHFEIEDQDYRYLRFEPRSSGI